MANTLRYNNTIPGKIYYQNNTVKNVYYNNIKVWSASTPFAFTYTGSYATEGNLEGNFVIRFKTSGTLQIISLGMTGGKFDIFGVGGGSGGNGSKYGDDVNSAAGGAGGFTKTLKSQSLNVSIYKIIVGAGGNGGTGGFSKYADITDDIIGGSGIVCIRNAR